MCVGLHINNFIMCFVFERCPIEVRGHSYYVIIKIQTINVRRAYLHVYYDKKRATKQHDWLLYYIIRLVNGLMKGTVRMDSAKTRRYFSFQKNKEVVEI